MFLKKQGKVFKKSKPKQHFVKNFEKNVRCIFFEKRSPYYTNLKKDKKVLNTHLVRGVGAPRIGSQPWENSVSLLHFLETSMGLLKKNNREVHFIQFLKHEWGNHLWNSLFLTFHSRVVLYKKVELKSTRFVDKKKKKSPRILHKLRPNDVQSRRFFVKMLTDSRNVLIYWRPPTVNNWTWTERKLEEWKAFWNNFLQHRRDRFLHYLFRNLNWGATENGDFFSGGG